MLRQRYKPIVDQLRAGLEAQYTETNPDTKQPKFENGNWTSPLVLQIISNQSKIRNLKSTIEVPAIRYS